MAEKENKETRKEAKPKESSEKRETDTAGREIKKPAEHKNKGRSYLGIYVLIIIAIGLMAFNQYQLTSITGALSGSTGYTTGTQGLGSSGQKDLANVDLSSIQSTGYSIAALFPVEGIQGAQDAIDVIIPTGTPEYGEEMGVSFDDPVNSLALMSKSYQAMKDDIKNNYPDIWKRYLNLATKPVGISCEFCCGVGPVGITESGDLRCGCQHNPAVQTLTMWLMKNTDYDDATVLREVMKWKALFFPKKMTELALSVAGGDTSGLADLPGMVGGC